MTSMIPPPDFDPYTQPFTIFDSYGNNYTVAMIQMDEFRVYGHRLAINYASQIGASLVLLLVLLLLTRPEKRQSFIFIINALALFSNTIRCILLACFLTSTLWNPYFQITGDSTGITAADRATNVASQVVAMIVAALIYVSLCVQVWAVCAITPPKQRNIILGITSCIACVAFGLRVATVSVVIKQTLAYQDATSYANLINSFHIAEAVAIWSFSCVFTFKLGFAVLQRRRLNMPQFGPMQIVFIMGCQTMFVPAIFSLLHFFPSIAGAELATQALTVVCIFLPLSAIWAGVSTNTDALPTGPNSHHRLLNGEFHRSASSTVGSSTSDTADKGGQMSVCVCAMGKELDGVVLDGVVTTMNKKDIHIEQEFGFAHHDPGHRV
ncbi:pheromone alpha factor receptor [Coniothyrium glycines]